MLTGITEDCQKTGMSIFVEKIIWATLNAKNWNYKIKDCYGLTEITCIQN